MANILRGSGLLTASRVVALAFLSAVAVLTLNAFFLYQNVTIVREHQGWVEHSYEVIRELDLIHGRLREAENSQLAFQVTGLDIYPENFELTASMLPMHLNQIRNLTSDNDLQQERLALLETKAQEHLAWLRGMIEMRREQGRELARAEVIAGKGRVTFAAIQRIIQMISEEEMRLLSERSTAVGQSSIAVDRAFVISNLVNFALILLSYYFVRRYMTSQQRETERQADENWLKSGRAELNDALRGDFEVKSVGKSALSFLTRYLELPAANLYVALPEGLELCASIASEFDRTAAPAPLIAYGVGLVGEAAVQKKLLAISDLPAGYLKIHSSTGEAQASAIAIVPLEYQGNVRGVLELASFKPLPPLTLQLLAEIGESIALALDASLGRHRLQELLEETQLQAEELQSQQEELRVNNEELENQASALKQASDRLQNQQEELHQTNEELEQQAKSLEAQKDVLESKNLELESIRLELETHARELRVASRYKSEFLANMSHELRTPLNSLLILATLLAENRKGHLDEKEVEFAHTIHRSGADLLALINDILDLSKVEAGKLDLHLEAFPLSEVLDRLDRSFRHLAESKGLSFRIAMDDGVPQSFRSDKLRLEQILKNFLSNAIKFTSKGEVSLRVAVDGARGITISVHDSGIGIPVDKVDLIFEAFHQVDGSTSREYGGTGLGLTISRELARLLGARIDVESKPGAGSIFRLRLPHLAEGDQPEIDGRTSGKIGSKIEAASSFLSSGAVSSAGVSADVNASDGGGAALLRNDRKSTPPGAMTSTFDPAKIGGDIHELKEGDRIVLIVEDDLSFSKTLVGLAHESGFKAISVVDGETAFAVIKRYKICGVILDIKLPGVSGLGILEKLKARPETRHLPIHMVSGLGHFSKNALKLGAIGYFTKPVSVDKLRGAFTKIESVLSERIKKVLIVEDDLVQRNAVAELLSAKDIETHGVGLAEEALARLASESFDCMILDLHLPDFSGFELLDRLNRCEPCTKPPVIVYTGKDLPKDEVERLQQYSDSIIIKGVRSSDRLLDEVSLFLHRVESTLPEDHQQLLRALRAKEQAFAGKTILVTDDDMRNVFALIHALERHDLKVLVAKNGLEALERLERHPEISLVLMDIMMPQMDGYEAMRRIRADSRFRRLPVIALTAKAMKGDYEKCLEAGASDYLAKPFDLERLLSLLRIWLPKGGVV